MRLFLFEFLSGGGLVGEPLPPTLAAEGRAMWSAVAEDFSTLSGISVVTTRDSRLPPLSLADVDEHPVDSAAAERSLFESLCRSADGICVIAPELEGELERRVRWAGDSASPKARLFNASPALCALASDKWRTFLALQSHGIATVPTQRLEVAVVERWPCVVKLRFGAGSQSMFFVRNREELDAAAPLFAGAGPHRQGLVQPFIEGRSLSCVALFDDEGQLCERLPVAEQVLGVDDRFTWRGGRIPASGLRPAPLWDLMDVALQALATEAGGCWRGPVGFDFLQEAETGQWLIVDVNPRFTTSYIGYRQSARQNPVARLLRRDRTPLIWSETPLEFGIANDANSR